MVHTEPFSREHLPHITQIAVAAFSASAYPRFLRPRHAEFPDRSFYHSLQKFRNAAVSADSVIRVAYSDDRDPWVDVGLTGFEAQQSKWIRGELVNGEWQSADLVDGELQGHVCEGRPVGFALWERRWPKDPEDARAAKEQCGSGTVWPVDTLWTKTERAFYNLESTYRKRVNPDPSYSLENSALVESEGGPQLMALTESALERSKRVGHISLKSIAVDPAFHRHGIGAQLMRWGLERAEVERCPILLVATAEGSALYEKVGFEAYGVITVRELTGDTVMAYWPKSFHEEGEEDVQKQVMEAVDHPDVKAKVDAPAGSIG